ncbi:MAG TPA: hypothetical protein VGE80_23325 [Schlesneria sp.]
MLSNKRCCFTAETHLATLWTQTSGRRPSLRACAGVMAGILCYATFILIVGTADAQERPTTKATVDELLGRLDAPTLSERSQAERQILDLGPQVLQQLPIPELIESVSARESIRRIRLQLERRAARESSRAARVTLEGDFSLEQLLQQIQMQTGNRLTLNKSAAAVQRHNRKVVWNQVSFWEALDQLCEWEQVRWRFAEEDSAITIELPEAESTRTSVLQRSGPFRLAIDTVERRPVVGEQGQQLIRVRGQLSIEPRLRPLFLAMAAADVVATADTDRLLAAWNPDARYEHPAGDGGRQIPVQWDYSLREPLSVSELSLQGRIHCQIAASTERIVFDRTSMVKGTVRRRGGVSVRLKDVEFDSTPPAGVNAEIDIAVTYDSGGPAFESHRTWIFHNEVYLETREGVRTSFTSFETTQQSDGAVGVTYYWTALADPRDQYRFVYEAPTLIINVPVDIDLRKIPVPKETD